MTQSLAHNASFARRAGAAFYDALLVAGLLFFTAAIALLINAGDAPQTTLLRALLLLVMYLFFVGFWTHGGQTLGMRAWQLHVVNHDGHTPRWRRASYRFLAMLLTLLTGGLGFLWMLVDADGLALHDRLSATRIVHDRRTSRLQTQNHENR